MTRMTPREFDKKIFDSKKTANQEGLRLAILEAIAEHACLHADFMKLQSRVADLEREKKRNYEIINGQTEEIAELRTRVADLERECDYHKRWLDKERTEHIETKQIIQQQQQTINSLKKDFAKPCVIHEEWCLQYGTHLRSCSCDFRIIGEQ